MPEALGGLRWKRAQRVGYVALTLVVVHVVVAGLPPISLVAVVAALIPLVVKGKRVLEEKERRKPT